MEHISEYRGYDIKVWVTPANGNKWLGNSAILRTEDSAELRVTCHVPAMASAFEAQQNAVESAQQRIRLENYQDAQKRYKACEQERLDLQTEAYRLMDQQDESGANSVFKLVSAKLDEGVRLFGQMVAALE